MARGDFLIKKAIMYFKIRAHEALLCVKEFRRGQKLRGGAFKRYNEYSILVDAHRVEKGLGLRSCEPGHSGALVSKLLSKLTGDAKTEANTKKFYFRETLRVIMAWIDYQQSCGTQGFREFDAIFEKYTALCDKLGGEYLDDLRNSLDGGAKVIPSDVLTGGRDFDFDAFVSSRHSLRSFSDTPVDEELIRQAVKMANKCPSACNRQPSHVYFSGDSEIVAKIDGLITGNKGFAGEIPSYLVVTVDRTAFQNNEQFQWYINGGIYLGYLTLALHSLGIGHCVMQWKAFHKTENDLKALLGISREEAIIAIVGAGLPENDAKCICAQRMSDTDTLTVVHNS